jgi:hypothetical protein
VFVLKTSRSALGLWVALVVTTASCEQCDPPDLNQLRPQLVVDPANVSLSGVPIAQNTVVPLDVVNDAISDLRAVSAEMVAGSDPAVTLLTTSIDVVLGGSRKQLFVNVRPLVLGRIEASVRVSTTDNVDGPKEVIVPFVIESIDAGLPDIDVSWPAPPNRDPALPPTTCVEFAKVGKNDVARTRIDVRNTGVRDLLVNKAVYIPDVAGDETVQLSNGLDVVLDRALAVPPTTSGFALNLVFRSTDTLEHTGKVVIESSDPDENPVEVCVIAQASDCPVAIAEFIAIPESIEPLDTLRLTGENSIASTSGSSVVRYEWRLLDRPVGSSEDFSDPQSARTEITVDVAGTYSFGLDVFDLEGVKSCETAVLEVDVIPSDDLLLQLVWSGQSSDFDIHVLREGGELFNHDGDCYFSNRQPQWTSVPEENPEIDGDDDDGYGPENASIKHPRLGSNWRVFIHYWNKNADAPPITATLRMFAYGQQVVEVSKTFSDDEFMWSALDIDWGETPFALPVVLQPDTLEAFARPF